MRSIARAVSVCLCVALPGLALAAPLNPVGQWELATGESRYKISYCGAGGTLCARLTWLRDDVRTASNLALLNREIVSHAVPGGENTWVGRIKYDGETYDGTVKLISNDAMRFNSCSGLFCKTVELRRK